MAQELREKKYQPQAVRRVFIPKRGGTGRRPLGIPSIRDRTVQMATVLALGPIFEADLPPEQHAYRPERDALSAVMQVYKLLKTGHTKVIDADLAAYFDSIPHENPSTTNPIHRFRLALGTTRQMIWEWRTDRLFPTPQSL